jgi:predicted permease
MKDIRYALRGFRKNPSFTAIAILSLALGIGANTAIFSLLDRVLLRYLPVQRPAELVLFKADGPRRGSVETNYDDRNTFSYPMYKDFRDRAPMFNGVLAWLPAQVSWALQGRTELVQANLVTGNFFDVLGVETALGRPLTPDDDRVAGAGTVAVLSHGFWEEKLGSDPGVLNRTVSINGHSMTIIGVAERGFQGLAVGESPALFIPVTMEPQILSFGNILDDRRSMWLNVIARLRPGITARSAESAMNVFWRPILEAELKEMPHVGSTVQQKFLARHFYVVPAGNGISALRYSFATPLVVLMCLAGLVLLIACANLANLLIARAAGRQREIAIRLALGASRGAIVRQILMESLVLTVAGGVLGVALAAWTGGLLLRMVPMNGVLNSLATDPDLRVLGFTAAVAIVSGILFGLTPALQATKPNVASTLKEQAGSVLASASQVRYRKVLVVAQVALSLLLLVGAGLFLRSLRNLNNVDAGFRADRLIGFSVNPTLNGYTSARAIALFDRIGERLRSLPGVRYVSLSQTSLLTGDDWVRSVVIPGREPKEGESAPNSDTVSPGFFAALGTPLVAGREFTVGDGPTAPRVAIINETFAKVYFEGQNPLGRQFYFSGDAKQTPIEIVGIVKDSKYADLREEKQRFVFSPYPQQYTAGAVTFYVRTSQEPQLIASALRQAVREADSDLPVFDMKTMEQQIQDSVFADRMVSALSAFFGLLATLLAAIGLYGVMAYTVTRRTREIGIRIALGASRGAVLRLVLSEVALLVGIGLAIALPLSFPLSALAQSLLFGVPAHDPLVLAGAAILLGGTAMLAGYLPASRAARVEPLIALRHE